MSQFNTYRTGKLKDREIIKLFDAIEKEFGVVTTSAQMGQIQVNHNEADNRKLLIKSDGFLLTRVQITTGESKITVQFMRGIGRDATNPNNAREPSPYFDEVIVSYNHQPQAGRAVPSLEEVDKCDKIIRKFITNVIPNNVSESANNATDLLHAQMSDLSSQYQDMISGIDIRRAKLDKDHDARIATLDKKHKARLEALEEKIQQNESKHQKKVEALNKREGEIDNKHHMHARREQREKIGEEVKERLSKTIVSSSSQFMRLGVLFLSFTASCFLGALSYQGLSELSNIATAPFSIDGEVGAVSVSNQSSEITWFLMLKTFLSSIGAIGFLGYAIKWLQRLYLDDVRMERELEQYGYDINRASWAIETIMEMQVAKNLQPPQAWISAVCGDLFKKEGNDNKEVESPIEALLNSSAKIELGTNGSKFELSSKGAKKLTKEVANK